MRLANVLKLKTTNLKTKVFQLILMFFLRKSYKTFYLI